MNALTTVSVREFREKLRHYLDELKSGGVVEITSHGKPVLKLEGTAVFNSRRPPPRFGDLKGKIWIADDFDAPLEEFEDAYEGLT